MAQSSAGLQNAALTIAGSDSCGGAGIQADLKTFHRLGVHGASVITAVTAQNTLGVHATEVVATDVIAVQLEAVLDDLPVGAIKTGMLPDARVIETIANILLQRCAGVPLIVDPVLVATSGAGLTVEDTIESLKDVLFPLATLVTPNLVEAQALTGMEEPRQAGEALLASGCQAVLIKGGHAQGDEATDILLTAGQEWTFSHPLREGEYHGTGCTLSAAIAAHMAQGDALEDAVRSAVGYVQEAMAGASLPLRGDLHLLP